MQASPLNLQELLYPVQSLLLALGLALVQVLSEQALTAVEASSQLPK